MVDPDDLPLLGETFAVELANSLYRDGREELDFLADFEAVTSWFRHAPDAVGIAVPDDLSPEATASIRRIRDATRLILSEVADGDRSGARIGAAEVLLREARRAVAHPALDVSGDLPAWFLRYEGSGQDIFVAGTAGRCMQFLGGPDVARVRRCERPACPMFFVQRHRARRFCHESCAHSIRQARYYRSAQRPRKAT